MKNNEKLKITEDLSVRQTEYIKNTVFGTITEKINDESDYEDMRCTWNLFISKMQSEAIIEALNSHLRSIYDDTRQRLKIQQLLSLLQSKSSLPTSLEC